MDKETALKILRELHDKALFSERTALETLHPELKESEDERIKKSLIEFVKQSSEVLDKQNQNNMIDWLEKQGEFDANIITRDDEILQALSISLSDVTEKLRWSDFGGLPVEEIQNWLEKKGEQNPVNDTDEDIVEAVKDISILDMVEPKFKVGDTIIKKT